MTKRPGFKDLMRADIKNVFLNTTEFGTKHTVNGKSMDIIIDDNELIEREKKVKSSADGFYKKQTLIYVSAQDYGPLPGIGKPVTIDEKTFFVMDSLNENGIYSIYLEVNRS